MKVKLIMLSGGSASTEYDLEPPVIVGRGRKAGIAVPHSLISRQHCEIYESDGRLMIRDLGSLNGTLLNRRRLDQPSELCSGDTLFLGPVMFRVEFADACATKRHNSDETAVGDTCTTHLDNPPHLENAPNNLDHIRSQSLFRRLPEPSGDKTDDGLDVPTSRSAESMKVDPDPTDSPCGQSPDAS